MPDWSVGRCLGMTMSGFGSDRRTTTSWSCWAPGESNSAGIGGRPFGLVRETERCGAGRRGAVHRRIWRPLLRTSCAVTVGSSPTVTSAGVRRRGSWTIRSKAAVPCFGIWRRRPSASPPTTPGCLWGQADGHHEWAPGCAGRCARAGWRLRPDGFRRARTRLALVLTSFSVFAAGVSRQPNDQALSWSSSPTAARSSRRSCVRRSSPWPTCRIKFRVGRRRRHPRNDPSGYR
jgi:hypothetical protein